MPACREFLAGDGIVGEDNYLPRANLGAGDVAPM
jgi:hypothetical protein